MKSRLIILSDLWGKEKADWISGYVELLNDKFDIEFYDCCELGNIDKTYYNEKNLHSQFVNGGIEKAVENLLKIEKGQIDVLAFSIGGTIVWKAALKGLNVRKLFAFSSTRLRYENEIPNGVIKLYYGGNDNNKPSEDWLKKGSVDFAILKNRDHSFYIEKDFIASICGEF